jgi:hypothetical protein
MLRIMAFLASDAACGPAGWEVRAIVKRLGRNEINIGRNLRMLEAMGYVCKIGRRWHFSADDKKWAPTHESYAEMIALYIVVKRPWLPSAVEFQLGAVAHGLRRLRSAFADRRRWRVRFKAAVWRCEISVARNVQGEERTLRPGATTFARLLIEAAIL